jgi:hypothetical protein
MRPHLASRCATVEVEIAHQVEELVPRGLVREKRRACEEHSVRGENDHALGAHVRHTPSLGPIFDVLGGRKRSSHGDALEKVGAIAVP